MIQVNEISAIRNEQIILDTFKVKRIGEGIYTIIGYWYGEEETKLTGSAEEVVKFLNSYFGHSA